MSDLGLRTVSATTARPRRLRTQLGALCYRLREGRPQVLLVTSRGTGRWVIPKGWPIGGKSAGEAVLQEAWEEAGVAGRLTGEPVGIYSYVKGDRRGAPPCVVAVFPVRVKALAEKYPEARQRRRKWLSPEKAAARVAEPELRRILLGFAPPGPGGG